MPTIITNDNIKYLVEVYLYYRNGVLEDILMDPDPDGGLINVLPAGFLEHGLPEDLRDISISDWDVSHVTNMDGLFADCEVYGIESLDNWNVSNVTSMEEMFNGYLASDVNSIGISNWDVSSVENMKNMFRYCYFSDEPLNWDVSSVENMEGMFYGCRSFNLDLSEWDVSSVENMKEMFYNCYDFNCDLSKWDVSNVENMEDMFFCCISFNQDLSKWNVSSVKNMRKMFLGCLSLTTKPNWLVSQTANTEHMFYNTSLDGQQLESDPYNRAEANAHVRNTNALFRHKKFNKIPKEIVELTKSYHDPLRVSKTLKNEDKIKKKESIEKPIFEQLRKSIPNMPDEIVREIMSYKKWKKSKKNKEHPGGGGYAGGRKSKRARKRTQKRNKKA